MLSYSLEHKKKIKILTQILFWILPQLFQNHLKSTSIAHSIPWMVFSFWNTIYSKNRTSKRSFIGWEHPFSVHIWDGRHETNYLTVDNEKLTKNIRTGWFVVFHACSSAYFYMLLYAFMLVILYFMLFCVHIPFRWQGDDLGPFRAK